MWAGDEDDEEEEEDGFAAEARADLWSAPRGACAERPGAVPFARGVADDHWSGASRAGGKSGHLQAPCRVKHAGAAGPSSRRRKVSQKLRPPRGRFGEPGVRVKRRGKSPPLDGQPARHEKPHGVQDITGSLAAWPGPRERVQLPGISRISASARARGAPQGAREMIITARGDAGRTESGLSPPHVSGGVLHHRAPPDFSSREP